MTDHAKQLADALRKVRRQGLCEEPRGSGFVCSPAEKRAAELYVEIDDALRAYDNREKESP